MRPLISTYRPASIGERARELAREEGAVPVAGEMLRWLGQYATGLAKTARGTGGAFEYRGSRYPYLAHRYNWTWLNERAVEVPIAQSAVAQARGGRVLEVGNVLGHYGTTGHVVVDRYERGPGLVNADILSFEDERGFDLIVSVSTLEHVGWDEEPREPAAAASAFEHLTGLLAPGGTLLATVPVGYNTALDAAIRGGELELSQLHALRRQPSRNIWNEVEPGRVWDARYDSLLCTAHGVVVCEHGPR